MSEEEKQFKYQLLSFSKDILWEIYSQEVSKAASEWDFNRYAYENNRLKDFPKYTLPSPSTAEDIIKMAETFEKYCSGKKSK